jgi:hypothetical protein
MASNVIDGQQNNFNDFVENNFAPRLNISHSFESTRIGL